MPVPKDKKKFSLWVHEETLKSVDELYKSDNCISRSEFIENAILFYAGYLTANNHKSYLPNMFISTMKAIVDESDNRTGRVLLNIIAADHEIDDITLERLRGECVQEVKRLNGDFSMKEAMEWQHGR